MLFRSGLSFAREKDRPLATIAASSGGRVFDAYNEAELSRVYSDIRKSILEEYRVSLRVPVSFDERPEIGFKFKDSKPVTRSYATGLLFTQGPDYSMLPGFLLIITGITLWVILFLLKFERAATAGELKFLAAGSGTTLVKTQILTTNKTIIGSSANANMTITGIPTLKDSHAVIEKNDKTGTYTVFSKTEIMVNNQPVTERVLKPGDVLNMEGATLIFDSPEEK